MRSALTAAVVLAGLSVSPAGGQVASGSRDTYARGVVGLEVTYQSWDEDRPWAKQTPKIRNASAVVVSERHLLTNARMVDEATLIRLVTFGQPRPVEPRVERVDPDVNLALLVVDDPAALEGLEPVELAGQTPTSGTLRTVRWRGQQLESAASRITRFEVERGWGGRVEHVFVHMQTDIAGGGWAEPVFDDGALVGITVSQSKQISRAVPAEVLRPFLTRALAPGDYVGFPALGVPWQTNRDPSVTRFLGQRGDPRGILVRQVPWGSSGCGVLEPRDILLEMDGRAIDAEGYYLHPRLGRLRFNQHLVEHHRPGDTVPVRVLRGGEEIELQMTLRGYPASLDLIPRYRAGAPPYAVAGGLLMRELDAPYLNTWGKDWSKKAPLTLLSRYYLQQEGQTPERRRIVLLTAVLPSAYNVGYQNLRDVVVERINGRPIAGIPDVVEALEAPLDGFHVFDLSPDSVRGQVVLDAAGLAEATAEVLESYRIPAPLRLPELPPAPGGGDCPGDF